MLRTNDLSYGADYWDSLDGGAGYQDSVLWEDFAFVVRELLAVDSERGDISGELNLADFGCAFGFLVRHLRRRGIEAWGFDISSYALSKAPEDVAPFVREFDLTSGVPRHLAGYPFSRFVCLETMEHIPVEHVGKALNAIKQSLTPGGRGLFAICTSDREGWESDPTHITIYPREWWSDRLRQAGFRRSEAQERWLVNNFYLFRGHSGIFVVERPLA